MLQLFVRNLGFALVLWIAFFALSFLGKSAGGFLLFGGFWVLLFGCVCWRTVATFGKAIEANRDHHSNIYLLQLQLMGQLLGVLLAQIVLYTLGVYFLDGYEVARKALFFFIGVGGSTCLLAPAYFWFGSHRWLQPVIALFLLAGLYVWWEVARNLWSDKLFMDTLTGMCTFTMSMLLALPALDREFNPVRSE